MQKETNILICEDNQALSSLLKFKLKRAGYTNCQVTGDGKNAKQLIQDGKYDLVITDIHMPYVSGLELTTFIRKQLESEIPIIILSSEGAENTVLGGFDMGASDYLTKPFSPNELIARVKKVLN